MTDANVGFSIEILVQMESSNGINESLCDATSLQGLHYGQFFKPTRRQSRFAFGRTYYDEETERGGNAAPEAIKYHNYVYVSEDEIEGATARSAVSRSSGGSSRSAGTGGGRAKSKGKNPCTLTTDTGKKVPSQLVPENYLPGKGIFPTEGRHRIQHWNWKGTKQPSSSQAWQYIWQALLGSFVLSFHFRSCMSDTLHSVLIFSHVLPLTMFVDPPNAALNTLGCFHSCMRAVLLSILAPERCLLSSTTVRRPLEPY